MKKITLNNQNNMSAADGQPTVDESTQMVQNQDSVSQFALREAEQLSVKPIRITQEENLMKKKQKKMFTILCVVAIVAGIGTGFGAFKLKSQQDTASQGPAPVQQIAEGQINKGDVFGIQDSDTFSDEASGYLLAGGINGEGSHRLLRPGGESQTVYLTSTVTDLDLLVGMEIKVWGETYQGQKAGWLMDVGKVEVLETEGEAPFEEEL